MGPLVDRVLEVLTLKAEQIEPPPDLGAAFARSDFILGVGKAGKHVVFLLHIARVLSFGDAATVSSHRGLIRGDSNGSSSSDERSWV